MEEIIRQSFVRAAERMSAWADLLDRINVFPVADADTGRNLILSLRPLRSLDGNPDRTARQLLFSARGNSGNIAARFFSEFITTPAVSDIPDRADAARKAAYQAVSAPKAGTMLSVFDTFADMVSEIPLKDSPDPLVIHLANTVQSTAETLPELRNADVVDAGALGMFLFLETFFCTLFNTPEKMLSPCERFPGKLKISSAFHREREKGHCINAVIRTTENAENAGNLISAYGQHTVITSAPGEKGQTCLAVHLHSEEKEKIRQQFETIGHILQWSDESMALQSEENEPAPQCIRIMTDAAGSVTRADANALGITLLDSYILMEDNSLPESLFNPADLYKTMREGKKVSTSQASVFERHQHYQSAISQYEKVLYLCVGSVYTGNWQTAAAWKQENDPENRMILVDTGAASGRLGIMALSAARYAARSDDPEAVTAYAEKIIDQCEEFVFIDKLHYLAAGGRLSKTGAFFGDMLHMKPVISPQPDGARKVGMVRNRDAQTAFALAQLKRAAEQNPSLLILLEYTDNQEWVQEDVQEKIRKNCPEAEVLVSPLSLTSGVHMGPGTWGIAFVPKNSFID